MRVPCALLAAVCCSPLAAAPVPKEKFDAGRLETLAAKLPCFSPHEFGYGRIEYRGRHEETRRAYLDGLRPLAADNWNPAVVRPLLKHADPKVRVLAAAILFDREDPAELPALADLLTDEAAAFKPGPGLLLNTGFGFTKPDDQPPPDDLGQPQTVGATVRQMLRFPMEANHERYDSFADYWAARGGRKHTASWYLFRLNRATRATVPTPADAAGRLDRLAADVKALPPGYRDWVFLWLCGHCGHLGDGRPSPFSKEADVLAAGRRLGPAKLLKALQGDIPDDDPDFHAKHKPDLSAVLLPRARVFFRKADAAAIEKLEGNTRQARWAVAAAELDPQRAEQILTAAVERFAGFEFAPGWESGAVATALFRLDPERHEKATVDWLYAQKADGYGVPTARAALVREVSGLAAGRQLLAKVVEHAEFGKLDWAALQEVAYAVNGWRQTPVVPDDDLRKARHPKGMQHHLKDLDPDDPATKELFAVLDGWRKRIRDTKDEWANPK